jgi:hypothetical protein
MKVTIKKQTKTDEKLKFFVSILKEKKQLVDSIA